MASPVEAMEPIPQATDVKVVHVPENNCRLAPAGADESVMVGLVEVALKRYHTSLREGVPQPIVGIMV